MTYTKRASRPERPSRERGGRIRLPVGKIRGLKTKFAIALKAILPQNLAAGEVITWFTRVDTRLVGPRMLGFLGVTGCADDLELASKVYGTGTCLHRFRVRQKLAVLEKVQLVMPYPENSGKYLLLPRGEQAAEACRQFLTGLLRITRARERTLRKEYALLLDLRFDGWGDPPRRGRQGTYGSAGLGARDMFVTKWATETLQEPAPRCPITWKSNSMQIMLAT
ncbi:MAG: hypothetical protein RBG13Loki_0310 [Promethearchaeota archaeon CR_4]|nr:MAG: hypothetical protein RBG13Loki_0310 [Candidatus Lokiarchaeota archaeon CR_4]